jgi:carbon storage regulator
MLVLSRKVGESILLDGHIQVTVVEIRGDKIRLGIEAPRDVAVWREELSSRTAGKERRELAMV